MMQRAFIQVMRHAADAQPNPNRLLVSAVVLLCRIRRWHGALFRGWKPGDMPVFILLGGCADADDALYVRWLARVPADVLLPVPNLEKPCALIIGAEELSRIVDYTDRNTCVLFGDGAGAVVLSEGEGVRAVRIGARPDPDKIWQFRPLEPTPFVTKSETGVPLQMQGREVFRFAVTASVEDIKGVLADAGLGVEDVDYYMIHQANLRIVEGIRNRLGAPESKFPTNIGDHGNSSSASCPILLDECKRKGLFKKGDKLIFSAFGAGLLSAAALVEW
jgi:hypothetical protein